MHNGHTTILDKLDNLQFTYRKMFRWGGGGGGGGGEGGVVD